MRGLQQRLASRSTTASRPPSRASFKIGDTEAKGMFAALCEGGQVRMPLAKTFYSPLFGMVVDKFGVSWMVNVPGEMPKP